MIEQKATPGMGVNCYLVSCDLTKKAIVIDPGAGSQMLLNWIKQHDFEITHIILTHGHYDHIGAVEDLRKALPAQVAIHKDDAEMLTNPTKNLSGFWDRNIVVSPADLLLEDNQELVVGEMKIKILHTPGHTPGGICLLTEEGLISGDTLFDGSVGRTDFPGGDMRKLLRSIEQKLMVLDDQLPVFPGHESATTIGRERMSNPYVNGAFA
ncbi:MAG: Hydroxyacylglutathione hydrolase GloC [Candidatus Dichloromethanomonas elyunquensis]|nr:MAG: Hydroxyacylglutathione hydrolase GloC [Candidatus Dichloromethanomonas elyunquensis]